jgi:hypothetical protein
LSADSMSCVRGWPSTSCKRGPFQADASTS